MRKDAVKRSQSFDAIFITIIRRNSLERNSDLNITPTFVQEMDDKTLVHENGGRADSSLKQSSEKNNSSSKLVNNKDMSFGEAVPINAEDYTDVNSPQEVRILRNINKILATKLAKAERVAQLRQIQLKFYDKTNDAKFACKLVDVIDHLKLPPNDHFRDEALKILNSACPSIKDNDEKFHFFNSLLEEIEYDKAAYVNPGSLQKYCQRLIEYARKHPPVLKELQNQINENYMLQLKGNVEHEIMMKNNANGDVVDGCCENHQRQISSLEANLLLHREQLAMKDVQLRRLEEEIGNAHRCNQQLNAKLGSMVGTAGPNFVNREKELRKALKERTSECEALKKKVEKFERDRKQWENQKRILEAKQPMDVQMLQGQKRELTMQLDREQAEKQELFLQINSLIAQLADANRDTVDRQEYDVLKDENEKLKKQMTDVLATQSQLNTDVQNLQEEVRCKNREIENAQDESKKLRLIIDNDKTRLESSIQELEHDLQVKSAALQSLMLVKQDAKTNEADSAMITRLTVENEELRGQIDELTSEVNKHIFEIEEIKSENEKKLRNLQSELNSMRENAKEKEAILSKQNNEINEMSQFREALEKCKLDSAKISEKFEESEKKLAKYEKKYVALEKETEAKLTLKSDALTNATRKFEAELKEQETKFNQRLEIEEMRTQEAKKEVKNYQLKINNLEEELKVLKIQTDERRGVDEEMRLLHEELKQAKRKISAQAADLEKAETDADEAERSFRETISELEEEVRSVQEKLRTAEIREEKQSKLLLTVEQKMMESQKTSEKSGRKNEMLTKELEEVRNALANSNTLLESFKVENAKLQAKASLENEVLTLATSLQSARNEISTKHDEIAKLRKELREIQEENGRLSMDIDLQTQKLQQDVQLVQFERDELKKEIEKYKSDNTVEQQKNDLILVELRNEISKLEKQIIFEREKISISIRNDLESEHRKMLAETKHQYEQRITELNKEMEKLKASENSKIDELSAVMTNLKKELAAKGGNVGFFRIDEHHEFQSDETQNLDLSPRIDFEEKLAALKECIADVLEEKWSFEQSDCQRVMTNKATQTKIEMEEGRHIISINNDDEDEVVIQNDCNFASRSCKCKSCGEVWRLRAELAFLKRQIEDEVMDREHLQKHIQVPQTVIQKNQEISNLIKGTERNMKSDKLETEKHLEEEIEKLKMKLINAEECREQYKREIDEKDLDIASLKKDIEILTNNMKSLSKRLQESSHLEERNKVFEFENKNLLDECSSLKGKLTKLNKQLIEEENANIKKHLDEVKDLNQQLDEARQACESSKMEINQLREQSENLSKVVNQLENSLNVANAEKEQLKIESLEQRKEIEQLSCEQMVLKVTGKQLDEAVAKGERDAQELTKLKLQAKNYEELEKNRREELHDLRQQIQTVEEKWKLECKRNETNEQKAKKELEKLTEKNEAFIEDIKGLNIELDFERKRVIDLDIDKGHLLNEVKQLRNELESLKKRDTLEEDSSHVTKKLSELMAENARLAGELLKEHNLLDKESNKHDQQMEELLKKQDERLKDKEKLLREENRKELKKLTDDYEKRLEQCNEEWKVKFNNQIEILKREMVKMKNENEEFRSQSKRSEAICNIPTPPHRKRNGSAKTDGLLQISLAEENENLKKEIALQHRLVVVLRRKLQSMQQQQQQ